MNILFLAPEPVYIERGTPIAVDRALKVLSRRGDQIDVVTYHRGRDVSYENVTMHRIPNIPFIREIPPGFSWKKVVCDIFMFLKILTLVLNKRYHLVHAVEEAVFFAVLLKFVLRIPYVFDMDSHISHQLAEQNPWLFSWNLPLLKYLEGIAIQNAEVIAPVCEALKLEVGRYNSRKVMVLWDVSLIGSGQQPIQEDLREKYNLDGLMFMYVGNLESYQGIDLLLESFALVLKQTDQVNLVIIGGEDAQVKKYQHRASQLGIVHRVQFTGPRPIVNLAAYLSQADVLVSPRVRGNNTPMKIYSYLSVGKPILATNLVTHTQVLDDHVSSLAEPTPESFSRAMLKLIEDEDLRMSLGFAGQKIVEERHTFEIFQERLNLLYDWLVAKLDSQDKTPANDLSFLLFRGEIKRNELRISYQPIISLHSGQVVGFEALVRWQHPRYGLLYPMEFIPYADRTGQMMRLGEWILVEACQQVHRWEVNYPSVEPLMICINLTASQFLQPNIVGVIDRVLTEIDFDARNLLLEISGRTILQNIETSTAIANKLSKRGVRFYIHLDGSDGRSFGNLKGFPMNAFKIDSYLMGRGKSGNGYVKSMEKIVEFANEIGVDVIAVGVETEQQLAQLKSINCDYGQGFLFSKPLTDQEAERIFAAKSDWLDGFCESGFTRG